MQIEPGLGGEFAARHAGEGLGVHLQGGCGLSGGAKVMASNAAGLFAKAKRGERRQGCGFGRLGVGQKQRGRLDLAAGLQGMQGSGGAGDGLPQSLFFGMQGAAAREFLRWPEYRETAEGIALNLGSDALTRRARPL